MKPVFITGMARGGTTLTMYLMNYFSTCYVIDNRELHPTHYERIRGMQKFTKSYTHFVFKQPYGYFKDFPPQYTYKQLIFRGIKIISLIRDPRDVLVSRHGANIDIYWARVNVTKRAAKQHLENMDSPEVLPIRYEDLVTDTKGVMDSISKFLGDLKYSDDFTTFHKEVKKTRVAIALHTPRPIDTDSIGNWKKPEHAARVKEILKDEELRILIRKLGYK